VVIAAGLAILALVRVRLGRRVERAEPQIAVEGRETVA
jgi:hypothetical protein